MLLNARKRTRGPLIYLRISTPVARCFKELFFIFLFNLIIFSPQTFQPTVFNQALNPLVKIHHFESLQIILYEENPSPCLTLEPLFCSSFATAVGGIRIINFVGSGNSTVARITMLAWFHKLSRNSINSFNEL